MAEKSNKQAVVPMEDKAKRDKQAVLTQLNQVYMSIMEIRVKVIELNEGVDQQFDCVNTAKLNIVDDIEREVKLINAIVSY